MHLNTFIWVEFILLIDLVRKPSVDTTAGSGEYSFLFCYLEKNQGLIWNLACIYIMKTEV